MKDKYLLNYYVEFKDLEGKTHYAIHQYRRTDGCVRGVRDNVLAENNPTFSEKSNKQNVLNLVYN